jgi:hypothetical protein
MATWVLEVRDLAGAVVIASATFDSLMATWVLDSEGTIDIDVPWETFSRTDWVAGGRELRLTRNGTRVWGGYYWRNASDREGGEANRPRVKANGAGYLSRLRSRVVTSDLIYTDVNQHQIGWNLINHTQGQTDGALGFTQGTHTGTVKTRSREYCALERPNIFDSIAEFGELEDGIDYEIDALGAFNTWSPRRGSASVVHTFTGAEEITFDWEEDASEAASYVSGVGSPSDDCAPRVIDVSDATAIARFKRLHHTTEARNNKKTEVTSEANEMLRERKKGMFNASLAYDLTNASAPAWGAIALGDMVRVNFTDNGLAIDETLRVVEMRLSLEVPDSEYMELTLDGAPT